MKLHVVLVVLGIAGLAAGSSTIFGRSARDEAHTTYWSNGALQSRIEYHDGRPDGRCERWYADGTKQCDGRYEAGRSVGEWTWYAPDGSLDARRSGNDGREVGN